MQKQQLTNLTIGLIVASVLVVVGVLVFRGPSHGVVARPDRTTQRDGKGGNTREPLANRMGGAIAVTEPEKGGKGATIGPDGQPLGPDGKPLKASDKDSSSTPAGGSAAGGGAPGNAVAGGPGGAAGATPTPGSGEAWDPTKPSPNKVGNYRPGDEEAPEDAGEDAGTIGGRVLRGDEPVEGAQIVLAGGKGRTVYSKPDGAYIFKGVNPGGYTLMLQSPPSSNSSRTLQLGAKEQRLSEDFIISTKKPVEGQVVNKNTGDGIGGARIEVWNGTALLGGQNAGEDGTFKLFPLEPGNYSLKGGQTGYSPGEQSFVVPSVGEAASVKLEMEPTGRLSGVVNGPDGGPMAGALVALFSSGTFADPYAALGIQTTDGSGRFAFNAPSGTLTTNFRAGAFKTGFVPAYSASFPPTGAPDGQDIVVTLARGGSVSGRVVDSETVALDGIDVTVKEGFGQSGAIFQRFNQPYPKATTGADGLFSIRSIELGPATLNFAAETFIPQDKAVTIVDGDLPLGDIVLESEEGTKEDRIFGLVVDEASRPMAGHYVLLRNTSNNQDVGSRTDNRGGFKFDKVPKGEYLIVTNGSALRGDIYITMDQRYPFAKPGDEKLYMVYDMAQSLRVHVIDQNNQPVRNFKVGVNVRQEGATGFGGVTESAGMALVQEFQTADGVAVVNNLIAGVANVTIATGSSGGEEKPNVVIPVGGQADLGDVVLKSGAPLEGIVTSAEDGSALSGVLVRLEAPAGSPASHPLNAFRPDTLSDSTGHFRFKGVPVTTVDIVLSRSGRVMKRVRRVEVAADTANDQGEIPMDAACILSGRLISPQGAAVVDVQIRVGDTVLFSDREGKFYADTFPPGDVSIRFYDPTGRFRLGDQAVSLQAGETKELNLTMQVIEGGT